jgi:hypothetical protein
MTPEQIRRILDPGQRRAGFDAWRAGQRGDAKSELREALGRLVAIALARRLQD